MDSNNFVDSQVILLVLERVAPGAPFEDLDDAEPDDEHAVVGAVSRL